jgi:hypothetical protein
LNNLILLVAPLLVSTILSSVQGEDLDLANINAKAGPGKLHPSRFFVVFLRRR